MTRRTRFRNASWLVAWEDQRHVYRRDIDLVIDGDAIVFVGQGYDGPCDLEVDATGKMLFDIFVYSYITTNRNFVLFIYMTIRGDEKLSCQLLLIVAFI